MSPQRKERGEQAWLQYLYEDYRAARTGAGFMRVCGARFRAARNARVFACSARRGTFKRKWLTIRRARTLAAASSLDGEVKKTIKGGGNIAAAKVVGKAIAERARAAGVEKVVFDRGGYQYHGRIQALADAAREAGLKF